MDKGSKVRVNIVDMAEDGRGIGKTEEGMTVFVEKALYGDNVEAEIKKVKKNFAEAEATELLMASPHRVEKENAVLDNSVGCELHALDYETQLMLKEKKVKDAIKKLAKSDVSVESIIYPEKRENYRNKVVLHVKYDEKDGAKIGYFERGTHSIVEKATGNINSEISEKAANVVRDWINEEKTDVIKHLVVRDSKKTKDAMVVIVTKTGNLPNIELLVDKLTEEIPEIKTVVQNVNTKEGKTIFGKKNKVLFGEGFIYDYVKDYKFKISPETFFQVNTEGMEMLYEKAIDYADVKKDETVYDLYSGIGTITLLLSEKAKLVYGVESSDQSVKNASDNAEINGIENVEFIGGKTEEVLPKLAEEGQKADIVVLDPPRKGAEKWVLEAIEEISPKRIVYVSCNASTLARDIAYLAEKGYRLEKVQPVDMFPMTMHVESVVKLYRV